MQRIGRREIEAGHFRLVQQWGAGLEGVDIESAKARGIFVANVPATGANAESVAEHTMLLILSLLRDLPKAQANVRAGVLGAPLGNMLARPHRLPLWSGCDCVAAREEASELPGKSRRHHS